jgi:hypothetical protein
MLKLLGLRAPDEFFDSLTSTPARLNHRYRASTPSVRHFSTHFRVLTRKTMEEI